MATTPVVPISAAPAAPAPAPAPAAAPPAAPAAVAAPSTPAPAAPSAAPTAPATPAAGAPPATPSGPQPPAKLNPGEYGNAVDSYQAEVTWRQELEAFKAENPGVAVDDESPWVGTDTKPAEGETPAADAAAQPADGETKPADAETPAADADAETFSLDEGPASLTPQALNDLLKGDEALKAAIEGNPAAKGALFKMAREHAELSQFKGIFPNKDAATFARDTANRTVGLRSQFQMAETPEGMSKAFDSFMQEFAVIGADGKQVVDETGSPVYGDDLYLFGEHVVDRYADSSLAEVDARLAANQYTDEAQRERDNDLKLALSIIKDDLHPADGNPGAKKDPDLSHLPDDVRKEVQGRLDEAKRIEAANAEAKAGGKKQSRDQVRKEGTQQFFKDAGTRTFQQVDKIIDGLRKAGAIIPDWQLNTPLPGTQTSAFKNAVGMEIENHIKADPYESNKQIQLEVQYLANPTPENMAARVQAFDAILQSRDETGKSLLNRIVTKLVRKYGSEVQTAAQSQQTGKAPTASTEPKAGPAVQPKQMNADEAWSTATNQLAKEVKDWHSLSDSERLSQVFARQREILTAKR